MLQWTCLALALSFAPAALADDDAKAQAQVAYHDGETAYAKGDFTSALASFQHAYDLAPLPALLFNMAQCYRKLNDHAHAVETLEKYEQLEKNVPAQRKKDLKSQLTSEKKLLAADEKKNAQKKPTAVAAAGTAAAAPPTTPTPTPTPASKAPAGSKTATATPAATTASKTPAPATPTAATPPTTTTPAVAVATPLAPNDKSTPAGSFLATPAATTPAPLTPEDTPAPPSKGGPLWTNPIVIGVVVGAAVVVAGGTTVALVSTAPGPTPPHTSLGTVDLRKQ